MKKELKWISGGNYVLLNQVYEYFENEEYKDLFSDCEWSDTPMKEIICNNIFAGLEVKQPHWEMKDLK